MNILILFNKQKKCFRRIKYAYLKMDDVFCDVIIIPYSFDDIENMSGRKFNMIYKKIYPMCKYALVFSALPERLKTKFLADNIKVTNGYEINIKYIKEIIILIGSYSSSIGVFCEKITEQLIPVIYRLCEITSIVHIFTYDTQNYMIDEITETALTLTGTPVNVTNNMSALNNIDILVTAEHIKFSLPPNIRLIDICSNNNSGIYSLNFSIPQKYDEIAILCGSEINSSYIEFLSALEADFSKIKIRGFNIHPPV